MLVVGKGHPLACICHDVLDHRVITHGKVEDLCWYAGLVEHREFALPCFADPAFLGQFLYVADAFSSGLSEMERYPSPG